MKPIILSPAGNKDSLFAAVEAGADAIYCGLKNFSLRAEAENFSIAELSSISSFLKSKNIKLFIALNSILKPNDLKSATNLLFKLDENVKPDAIIISDLAILEIIRQLKPNFEVHLSTIANLSFPSALRIAKSLNIKKIVLPRELSIDEIRNIADKCPPNISLEVFVYGALCYGVSGKCYWSSFLGGKSGLRGRCVQPCRRLYKQGKDLKTFFSCSDLSLDVLAKLLLEIKKVDTWKIEGRRKGANYVYYTTKAYKLFRDNPNDPSSKKLALSYLDLALGRSTSHYNFLSHRKQTPIDLKKESASGKLVAKSSGSYFKPYFITREELFEGDLLRIGNEDDNLLPIRRYIPKKGRFVLKSKLTKDSPIFLIDRREKFLKDAILKLDKELEKFPEKKVFASSFKLKMPMAKKFRFQKDIEISNFNKINSKTKIYFSNPVVWDEKKEKEKIVEALKSGVKFFILNSIWHISFFTYTKDLEIWAGPFCNISNPLAIESLRKLGFNGVIVNPELSKYDYFEMAKNSPLPLGILIYGNFPISISRIISDGFKLNENFESPKNEIFCVKQKDENYYIYPNWLIDLQKEKKLLLKNGYSLFLSITEEFNKNFTMKQREGLWNWNIKLL